ncbi:MAG: AzlD domain-containing protein [Chlamydiales bacterium]
MILILIMMTLVSFSFRYAPFVLSRWLQKSTFLKKLGASLPLCILILLVAHTLQQTSCNIPEMIGLVAVVVAQLLFRNVLLSMIAGVFFHQILMRTLM